MAKQWDLTSKQRRVAELIALGDPESGKDYTVVEVCKMTDTPRSTFYEWRSNNPEFVEYINYIADKAQESHIADYYRQLDKIALKSDDERTQLKAIELVLKRMGKLRDNGSIDLNVNENKPISDMSLDELKRLAGIGGKVE